MGSDLQGSSTKISPQSDFMFSENQICVKSFILEAWHYLQKDDNYKKNYGLSILQRTHELLLTTMAGRYMNYFPEPTGYIFISSTEAYAGLQKVQDLCPPMRQILNTVKTYMAQET